MLWIMFIGLLVVGLEALWFAAAKIGPKNIIGMIRYDQRKRGTLRVGDIAANVSVLTLDGKTQVRLAEQMHGRPCVLIFGSFT